MLVIGEQLKVKKVDTFESERKMNFREGLGMASLLGMNPLCACRKLSVVDCK